MRAWRGWGLSLVSVLLLGGPSGVSASASSLRLAEAARSERWYKNCSVRCLLKSFLGRPPKKQPPWPKGPCISPQQGEKIVYFVHHADAPYGEEEIDGKLYPESEEQARALAHDRRLARALSQDPADQAQVIVVSPARKALQTAILAFDGLLHNATWEVDPRIRGKGKDGKATQELGATMLAEMNRTVLLTEYKNKFDDGWHGGHERRWHSFLDSLRQRPEQRFIVVAHAFQMECTGMEVPVGEVRAAALLLDPGIDELYGGNAWRELSDPACWPRSPPESL